MRHALLLAGLALPPLLIQPAGAQSQTVPQTAQPQIATADAAAGTTAAIRVRTGQHSDRGRVVLHLGTVPGYELRRAGTDYELRLRGRYQLSLGGQRNPTELAGMEARIEGDATILRLRPACDCTAETGTFDGMLYVDLRPAQTAHEPASPAQLAAARRRLLDDAVRLGLLRQDQAIALLRGNASLPGNPDPVATAPTAMPAPTPVATTPSRSENAVATRPSVASLEASLEAPLAAPASPAPAPPPSTPSPATPLPPLASPAASRPASAEPSEREMTALRDSLIGKLTLLNGTAPPTPSQTPTQPQPVAEAATAALPSQGSLPASNPSSPPAMPSLAAISTPPRPEAPLPNPAFPPPPEAVEKPLCLVPGFTMQGWPGAESYNDQLATLRGALARSDGGAEETAALAEFYTGHEMPREALQVLSNRPAEWPSDEVRTRLERVRDIARLLARQPIDPASPLLVDQGDCTPPDRSIWSGLVAAQQGDATGLARMAPQIRAALRDLPADLRQSFVAQMTDAVEEDSQTQRTLLGALRGAGAIAQPRPEQQAQRSLLMARLAHSEGNRPDEILHLETALRTGRNIPALWARTRLAALQFDRPGAEGQQAERMLLDASRTYRFDALGEEAAILYAQRLLERGDLAGALAVADGASQASLRPSMESRGARLAAQALRLLLVDAKGTALPPAGERLALFWQYEGYATPGERGDDIRRGAVRLMLQEGLADAALDTARQLTPASLLQPEGALLAARSEALATQGDAQRALALLRNLPPSEAARRASSAALARVGQAKAAAEQLAGLGALADRQRRAGLLFQAQSWPDAAAAYAELLHDPDLDTASRTEATQRLAAASALSGAKPDVPAELLSGGADAKALLHLSGAAPAEPRGVAGARAAIARSRQVEALLPTTGRN